MFKLIKLIIGINLVSYALVFYIMYLNLFILGYDITYYLLQIITHLETLLILPGIYFLWDALHTKKKMV